MRVNARSKSTRLHLSRGGGGSSAGQQKLGSVSVSPSSCPPQDALTRHRATSRCKSSRARVKNPRDKIQTRDTHEETKSQPVRSQISRVKICQTQIQRIPVRSFLPSFPPPPQFSIRYPGSSRISETAKIIFGKFVFPRLSPPLNLHRLRIRARNANGPLSLLHPLSRGDALRDPYPELIISLFLSFSLAYSAAHSRPWKLPVSVQPRPRLAIGQAPFTRRVRVAAVYFQIRPKPSRVRPP